MNRCSLIFILLVLSLTSYSQRVEKVTARYTYYAPENVTLEEHQTILLQQMVNQNLVDEKDQQDNHAHETQRADCPKEEVVGGMPCEEDDKKHNPDDAILIEAL